MTREGWTRLGNGLFLYGGGFGTGRGRGVYLTGHRGAWTWLHKEDGRPAESWTSLYSTQDQAKVAAGMVTWRDVARAREAQGG